MKPKLTFTADKKSASEGDYISLVWDCTGCPDHLTLTIDSGYRCDTIAVADSGSTRMRLTQSKGKTSFTLKANIAGKVEKKRIEVRVKNTGKKASAGVGKFSLWCEKVQAGWSVWWAQMKCWWASLKGWKKAVWIGMLVLWVALVAYSAVRSSGTAASDAVEQVTV